MYFKNLNYPVIRITLVLAIGIIIFALPMAVNSKEPPSEEIKKANAGLNTSLNSPTTLEERVRVATQRGFGLPR